MRRTLGITLALASAVTSGGGGCSSPPVVTPAAPSLPSPAVALDLASASAPAPASGAAPAPGSKWSPITQSPWVAETDRDPREVSLTSACGTDDGALARLARELVELRARGLGAPDSEAIVAKLRAAGEPYVRPRVIGACPVATITRGRT